MQNYLTAGKFIFNFVTIKAILMINDSFCKIILFDDENTF